MQRPTFLPTPRRTTPRPCLLLARSLNPPPVDGTDTRTGPCERIPFWVIGNEGGYFSQPVQRDQLIMGPAERYDIIFDFRSE